MACFDTGPRVGEVDPVAHAAGGRPRIGAATSRTAWLIPTEEQLTIARQTRNVLAAR